MATIYSTAISDGYVYRSTTSSWSDARDTANGHGHGRTVKKNSSAIVAGRLSARGGGYSWRVYRSFFLFDTSGISAAPSSATLKVYAHVADTGGTINNGQKFYVVGHDYGGDLNAAADLVGKSFGSSTNALSRYGIEVHGVVGSSERLESLTENIAILFGGQATAAAQTFSGRVDQMSNSLGDMAEAIGKSIVPVLDPFIDDINRAALNMKDLLLTFSESVFTF